MVEITAQAVKALRDKTGLPMMKCKQALIEAEGDEEKAVEILRREVGKVLLKRADNPTSEGVIRIAIADDASCGAMIELQCESAPVAANDEFRFLADQCAKRLLEGPAVQTPDELLDQPAPDRPGQTLRDLYEEVVNRIREKIVLARIVRLEDPVGGYVHHDGKTAVLLQVSGSGDPKSPILRDVAMHIAAMKSTVVNPEDLDPAVVEKERQRLTEEARATGKPEKIIEKIVEGRLKLFYQEQGVLTAQPFVKDESKTVSQALAEHGFKPVAFVRWVLGTGT